MPSFLEPPESWFWYFGLSASDLEKVVTETGAQPIVIKPYAQEPWNNVTVGLQYAAILATYAEEAPRWYDLGKTASEIGELLAEREAMPVYLAEESTSGNWGSTPTFSVIMVPAEGDRWWWYGQSRDEVDANIQATAGRVNSLQMGPNGFAVTILDPPPQETKVRMELPWSEVGTAIGESGSGMSAVSFGGFDEDVTLIAAPEGSQGWWWYLGLTPEEVGKLLSENNAHLIDIFPYWVTQEYFLWSNYVVRFAVIMRGF